MSTPCYFLKTFLCIKVCMSFNWIHHYSSVSVTICLFTFFVSAVGPGWRVRVKDTGNSLDTEQFTTLLLIIIAVLREISVELHTFCLRCRRQIMPSAWPLGPGEKGCLLFVFQPSFIRRIKGENVFIRHSKLMLEVGMVWLRSALSGLSCLAVRGERWCVSGCAAWTFVDGMCCALTTK